MPFDPTHEQHAILGHNPSRHGRVLAGPGTGKSTTMVPGQKVGRHWRFNRAAIDKWLVGDSDSSGGQSGGKGGAR